MKSFKKMLVKVKQKLENNFLILNKEATEKN